MIKNNKLKVSVLVSGGGTNLQALIEDVKQKDPPIEIVEVISNNPDAYGLERARKNNIPTRVLDHRKFKSREDFDNSLQDALVESQTDYVCLAGFMRLLSAGFVENWKDRMINIHPSLLPAFPGLNVHQRAIDAGVRFTGCTVHFVRPEMDAGPIILQAAVPVLESDSVQDLAARVLKAEHQIYPAALRWFAEGRIKVVDEKVVVKGTAPNGPTLIWPKLL